MNDATANDVAQSQFATAVSTFTPKSSVKFQKMMPFKDGIAELRRKHASYATIADILRNINVTVSHDTVTRFCHEVLGLTLAQRRRRKTRARSIEHKTRGNPQTRNTESLIAPGPRVADPNNV